MNNSSLQQVLGEVKKATNVLVTVSKSPTVDQLAAAVGLTLALNKIDKHATTVFSGVVPSTIDFLQPEKSIETTTDSLRDFIIALDRAKADKLRYKVEDDVVRIFITPYRSTISEHDLEFKHGDFNVDLVLALGVSSRDDLDEAIRAHGRILHDAVVVGVMHRDHKTDVGTMTWLDEQASSLCEMTAGLVVQLKEGVLDGQMSTAFLTGIIAETDRFKNEKTTPQALAIGSQLMAAGADQKLIADKLESEESPLASGSAPMPEQQAPGPDTPPPIEDQPEQKPDEDVIVDDGTLSIGHDKDGTDKMEVDEKLHESAADLHQTDEKKEDDPNQAIDIDDHGTLNHVQDENLGEPEVSSVPDQESGPLRDLIDQPASMPSSAELTAEDPEPTREEPTKSEDEAPKDDSPATQGQELFDELSSGGEEQADEKQGLTRGKTLQPLHDDLSRPATGPLDIEKALQEPGAGELAQPAATPALPETSSEPALPEATAPEEPPSIPSEPAVAADPVAAPSAPHPVPQQQAVLNPIGGSPSAGPTSPPERSLTDLEARTQAKEQKAEAATPPPDAAAPLPEPPADGSTPPAVPPPMMPQFYDPKGANSNPLTPQ